MVSVIIPAYNEEANLQRCLECVASQTISHDHFEVIVVDNGSTDSTATIAKAFVHRMPVKVESRPKGAVSAVRNHGSSVSSGEVLAFLDADCFAPEDWLAEALSCAPVSGMWGAHYIVPQDIGWVGRVWFEYQATPRTGPVSFLPAGDLFIRRKDFDRLGGFDESIETSEDVDLCSRAAAAGMPVIAIPALAVTHAGTPNNLRGFYRQNRWHGNHVLRVFLHNLPSLRNASVVGVSLYTLVLFWLTICTVPMALFWHRWDLLLIALCLLLVPGLAISIYRTARLGRPGNLIYLWTLYTTYFLARAAALTHLSYVFAGSQKKRHR